MLKREDESRIRLDAERIKHWMGQGALPTDRVALFLGKAGIIEERKRRETPEQSKPKAKAQERSEGTAGCRRQARSCRCGSRCKACARRRSPNPRLWPPPKRRRP